MMTSTILVAGMLGRAGLAKTATATSPTVEPTPGGTTQKPFDGAPLTGRAAPAAAAELPAPTERLPGSTRPGETTATDDVRVERKPAFLTASDIASEVAPYAPDIQRCYREANGDVPRASHVSLTLVIAADGRLRSLEASSPGLSARTTRRIAACARSVLDLVRFPARRNETIAVVPYYFQKTDAPNAGPQLSCWSAKGC